ISYFYPTTRVAIKSKSKDRENSEDKKQAESEAILAKLQSGDTLILFDESGKNFKSSREFSENLVRVLESKSGRIVFLIGGPYGFTEALRKKAFARWSLSGLTMNHHIAQVAGLEQIYRALTIWKGLPYHND